MIIFNKVKHEIVCEPAECYRECSDDFCIYTHVTTYCVNNKHFLSLEEAEKELERIKLEK